MKCNDFKGCVDSLEKNGQKDRKCLLPACLKSYDTRKLAVVEEKKKKYELTNLKADHIAVFQIDSGMISVPNEMKCDNLLLDIDLKLAVFVELKGTDLKHALEQVDVTVDRLLPGLPNYRIFARIVTSNRTNVPNIKSCPQYVRLKRKILANKGDVNIHANMIAENIENLSGKEKRK